MPLLWKYPCGCVGLGKPHAPRMEDKPAPRLLESRFGEAPQGLEEDEEWEYFSWSRNQRKNSVNWVRTKTVVRTLMEVSDE